MPCASDTRYDEGALYREAQAELDKVTRLLCALLNRIEDEPETMDLIYKNTELYQWWKAHEEADYKRRVEEQTEKTNPKGTT